MMDASRVAVCQRLGIDDYGVWAIWPKVLKGVKKNAQHIVVGITGVHYDGQIVWFLYFIHQIWATNYDQAAKAFTAAITADTSASFIMGPMGKLTTSW